MHIIYFVGGAKTTHFFMGSVTVRFLGSNPPAGSVSKRLLLDRSHGVSAMRHAEVLTPYLDRSLLETIYRSVGQSLGQKPGVGGWSHGGEMDRKFVRETRVFLIWFDGV